MTIYDLINNGYNSIPSCNGVYIVKVPKGFYVMFVCGLVNKTAPAYCVNDLAQKYNSVNDKSTVYIGKASDLKKRIRQYVNYGINKGKIHKGGRAIFQIKDFEKLEIVYYNCNDPEAEEKRLLKNYYQRNNSTLPLANWRF